MAFELGEVTEIGRRIGGAPDIAIGTEESDAEAYGAVGVPAESRYLCVLSGDPLGGTIFNDDRDLVRVFGALAASCF